MDKFAPEWNMYMPPKALRQTPQLYQFFAFWPSPIPAHVSSWQPDSNSYVPPRANRQTPWLFPFIGAFHPVPFPTPPPLPSFYFAQIMARREPPKTATPHFYPFLFQHFPKPSWDYIGSGSGSFANQSKGTGSWDNLSLGSGNWQNQSENPLLP